METLDYQTFDQLNLIAPIFRALQAANYERPTPIQAKAIPHLITGRDMIGCAQTGTGKTAAFALPILQRLAENNKRAPARSARALILTPTRELAAQVSESFKTYGRNLPFTHSLIFGGVGQVPQVKSIAKGVDILVATPGRLLDLMNQGYVTLSGIEFFVLDEADRMLDMGFLPDMKRIIAKIPKERQTLLFSATMAPEIMKLSEELLTDPVRVAVTPPSSTVDNIDERVLFVNDENKRSLLMETLNSRDIERVLIFTRTKFGANRLSKHLGQKGMEVRVIHGDKSQSARMAALEDFKSGRCRVLVATDIAARGIDVDGVSHVINYDMPMEPESYVHRIGRTGRAGATGIALSFCSGGERLQLRDIERLIKRSVPVDSSHPYHSALIAKANPSRTVFSSRGRRGRNPLRARRVGR